MDFSPLAFTYENSELSLAADVSKWLREHPTLADIALYIGKLPEERQQAIVNCVAKSFCEDLFEEKVRYFAAANFESFVLVLGEQEQLFHLAQFQEYNPQSVIRNIQQDQALTAPPTLPPNLSVWAKEYLENLDSLITFCAMPEALDLQFLLRQVKNAKNFEEINTQEIQVGNAAKQMQERFSANRPPTLAELEQEKQLWGLFSFIPVEFAQEQLGAEDSVEKRDLLINLHTALALMQSMQAQYVTPAEAPDEMLNFIAIRYVRENIRPEVVVMLNVLHEEKFRQSKEVKAINQLLHYFQELWTIDRIKQEQVSPNLRGAADVYRGKDLELFITTLYSFIRRSVVFDAIVPPYFIDFLLLEAAKLDNPNVVTDYAQDLAEDLENPQMAELFVHLFRELYVVTHTFKEVNV